MSDEGADDADDDLRASLRRRPRSEAADALDLRHTTLRRKSDSVDSLRRSSERVGVFSSRRGDAEVNAVLTKARCEELDDTFARERVDFEALRALRDRDFKAMGIPIGVKVKIQAALRSFLLSSRYLR